MNDESPVMDEAEMKAVLQALMIFIMCYGGSP